MFMKKIKELAFYCIPMIMIICSFITIFENTIWVDEAYSLELAKCIYRCSSDACTEF